MAVLVKYTTIPVSAEHEYPERWQAIKAIELVQQVVIEIKEDQSMQITEVLQKCDGVVLEIQHLKSLLSLKDRHHCQSSLV